MTQITVASSLPFPLRVDPEPYQIESDGTVWRLTVQRVQKQYPDERIAGPGTTMDLLVDREGRLAYSRVTGAAELDVSKQDPVQSFLAALNRLILHVRDVFGEYWIRTLEADDLCQLSVETDQEGVWYHTAGRGTGFVMPIVGRTEEGSKRLKDALSEDLLPPVWREMQLDARDALEQGRYEDCVVLVWSALEAACRQAVPGMAYRDGLSVPDLADRLQTPGRVRNPTISHEEAVARQSGGLRVVEVAAELTEPQIYSASAASLSVQRVYRLRNRILHQGARIRPADAREAWGSVDFLLTTALSLRHVEAPPSTLSWQARFGDVHPEVAQFADDNGLRLVLARPDGAEFEMELIGSDLWLKLADDIGQAAAAAHLLVAWRSRSRQHLPGLAQLEVGPPSGILVEGLVIRLAAEVQSAACRAESLMEHAQRSPVYKQIAERTCSYLVASLAAQERLDPNDSASIVHAIRIAANLAVLDSATWDGRLEPLVEKHGEVARLARKWAHELSAMDLNDAHSRCTVMRTIHRDSWWLDTIVVVCPIEGTAYGSRRWSTEELAAARRR